jgi:enoyl-CoA hydratase/carnithine racemase
MTIGGESVEQVKMDVEAGIATVTLWRPEHLNAFTDTMERELIEAFDICDADDLVRAVVLTGAGRAFCAGMDLTAASESFVDWRESPSAPPGSQFLWRDDPLQMRRDGGGRVVLRMYNSRKPIIAAINGHAVGVGATMVLAADARISLSSAKFGFVFARRGLVPESCSSWFLPRIVGLPKALDWMLSGRIFTADEARDAGLLSSTHDSLEDLLARAVEWVRSVTDETSAVSVAAARRLILDMSAAPHPMLAHHRETVALNDRGVSRDAAEGIDSFLGKRRAVFVDRVSEMGDDLLGPMHYPGTGAPTELPPGARPRHAT